MTSLPVSIGIAGIGNVGSEVFSQLIKHKEYKKSFTIKAVSYRNKKKGRKRPRDILNKVIKLNVPNQNIKNR
jgi:homoserine dehydrogenase